MIDSSTVVLDKKHKYQQQDLTLQKQIQSVGFFSLFRFADKLDIFLMIIGAIAAATAGAAMPSFALLWGNMTQAFSNAGSNNDLLVSTAKQIMYNFFEIGAGSFAACWVTFSCWMITGERQSIRCRQAYLRALLNQQIGWFDRINQTELSSKFAAQTFAFQGAIGEKIATFIMTLFMMIVGLIIAYTRGWLLSLVVTAYVPVIGIFGYFYVYTLQNKQKKTTKYYSKAGGKAQQAISSIKTVKSLNGEQYQLTKYTSILEFTTKSIKKYSIYASLAMGSMFSAMLFSYALSFWYGSQLVHQKINNGRVPYGVGDILTIFFSIITGGMNFSQVTPCLKKFSQGQQAAAKIFAVIDRKPKIIKKTDGIKLQKLKGIIKFQNVTFAYPKQPQKKILNNITLQMKPNQTNALVGESGCGKSTLMQLVMRFYDPEEGRITLDGVDIRQLDLQWLRQIIGYVGQQPVLFATSIKQNLLYGKTNATNQQIQQALKKAQAYDFIFNDLPQKLQTYVGSGGGQLSGGQKQRIAIARAILKNPPILLLDEATSALDRKNQRLIQQTLDKIASGRTTITIAHRVKTIMNAEQIFVIQKGKVAQHGHFKQLKKFKDVIFQEKNVKRKNSSVILGVQVEDQNENENQVYIKKVVVDPQAQKKQKQRKKKQQQQQLLKKYEQSIFSRLFTYNKQQIIYIIIGVIFSLGNGTIFPIFSLYLAQMMEVLIDMQYGIGNKNINDANFIALIFFILGIASFIAVAIQQGLFTIVGANLTKKLRIDSYRKILKMSISWFDIPRNSAGNLIARLETDCQQVNGLTSTLVGMNAQVLSTLITGLIIAFYHQWRVTLVMLGIMPFMIGAGLIQMKFMVGFSQQTDKAYSQSSNLIMEAMINIRTVTSFGVQNSIANKYASKLVQPMAISIKKGNIIGFFFGLSQCITFFTFAIIFYVGTIFIRQYNQSFVNVFTAIIALVFAAFITGNNAQFMPDVAASKQSAANIFSILDADDQDQLQQKKMSKNIRQLNFNGRIQFKNITFKYASRQNYVFQNFNMVIQSGKKIALVGPSGCGKSTIIQMLMRYYDAQSGQILLNGIQIHDYDIHYLRSIFGLVSQQPVLFYDTFRQNIKYNIPTITQQQMEQAARKANALTFITGNEKIEGQKIKQQQGQGFDKNVGPKGSHISGGQKQRVAITRTILRNPTILLLDEATSALDSKNESIVQASLDKIMNQYTTITIAHRIQTIKNSDKIYVFQHGQIIESGGYYELINKKGYFYNLEKGFGNTN